MTDTRMKDAMANPPFDGRRLIYGGIPDAFGAVGSLRRWSFGGNGAYTN